MADETRRADALVRARDVDASSVRRAGVRIPALVHVDATMRRVHAITGLASTLEATVGVHALRVRSAGRTSLALVYIYLAIRVSDGFQQSYRYFPGLPYSRML